MAAGRSRLNRHRFRLGRGKPPDEANHHVVAGVIGLGAAARHRELGVVRPDVSVIGLDRQIAIKLVTGADDALIGENRVVVVDQLNAGAGEILGGYVGPAKPDAEIGRETRLRHEVIIEVAHQRRRPQVPGTVGAVHGVDFVGAPAQFALDAPLAEAIAHLPQDAVSGVVVGRYGRHARTRSRGILCQGQPKLSPHVPTPRLRRGRRGGRRECRTGQQESG